MKIISIDVENTQERFLLNKDSNFETRIVLVGFLFCFCIICAYNACFATSCTAKHLFLWKKIIFHKDLLEDLVKDALLRDRQRRKKVRCEHSSKKNAGKANLSYPTIKGLNRHCHRKTTKQGCNRETVKLYSPGSWVLERNPICLISWLSLKKFF